MIRRSGLLVLSLALLVSCASNPPANERSSAKSSRAGLTQYLPNENVFPVGAIPNAVLHDSARNKDLVMSIEYPTRGGPFPVVIFSHGYGASKDYYTPLTEYWAGHGYICIKPSHADAGALRQIITRQREQRRAAMEKAKADAKEKGKKAKTDTDQKPPEEPMGESLWAQLTPQDWTNRTKDVTLIIDSLDVLEQRYPELAGKIQKASIGVAGHSLGAFNAMLVGGTTDFRTNPPIKLGDPRVRAIVAMSPQGISAETGLTAESWRDLKIPALFMTGSLDRGAGLDGDPKWRHDPFAYSPAGDKYFVSFLGARHGTFTGGILGDIEDTELGSNQNRGYPVDPYGRTISNGSRYGNPRGENIMARERRAFSQIKVITTAFFDDYLKEDKAGKDYMKAGGTLDVMNGPDLTVERK